MESTDQYREDRRLLVGRRPRRACSQGLPSVLLGWKRLCPVKNASGLGVAENQYNTTTFDEVITSKLKLEIDSDGEFSTGILEWKVYDSGKSPEFPPW